MCVWGGGGGVCIFIWVTKFFTTPTPPVSPEIPPTGDKKYMTPYPPHLPPETLTHIPFYLFYVQVTSIKAVWNTKNILFTFYRLTFHADEWSVFFFIIIIARLFFLINAYPEIWCLLLPKATSILRSVCVLGGGGGGEATAVLLMTRQLETWYHKYRLQINLRTKSSAQHEFIDHYILSRASGIQRKIKVKGLKLGIVTSFKIP